MTIAFKQASTAMLVTQLGEEMAPNTGREKKPKNSEVCDNVRFLLCELLLCDQGGKDIWWHLITLLTTLLVSLLYSFVDLVQDKMLCNDFHAAWSGGSMNVKELWFLHGCGGGLEFHQRRMLRSAVPHAFHETWRCWGTHHLSVRNFGEWALHPSIQSL